MALQRVQACGFIVIVLNIVNTIFLGSGVFLSNFYKDKYAMNDISDNLVGLVERINVRGLFLTSFVLALISVGLGLAHTIGTYFYWNNNKVAAIIVAFLDWFSFILCISGCIYVEENDAISMMVGRSSSAYGLTIAGTTIVGVTSICCLPYVYYASKE